MVDLIAVDEALSVDDEPILSQTTLSDIADKFETAHPADVDNTLRAMRKFVHAMSHRHRNRLTIAKMIDAVISVRHSLSNLIAYEREYFNITGKEPLGLASRMAALSYLDDVLKTIDGETVENHPLHILRRTFQK